MLQPREPNRISDSRFKKISSLPSRINMICFIYHNQNWSLALLTALILTIVHIDASQAINQPFLVSPTPTLQAIAADGENLQDLDDLSRSLLKTDVIDNAGTDADVESVSNESQFTKNHRKKSRKGNSGHKRSKQSQLAVQHPDPSIVTLYVSGRRPGEFSTVLSTVGSEFDHSVSLQKRHAFIEIQPTDTMNSFTHTTQSSNETTVLKGQNGFLTTEVGLNELSDRTASLESIVGDVDLWFAKSSRQSIRLSTTINLLKV
nr:uncharacterized protein LOC108020364 isoform X7 [Drosophila suzukii]